MEVEAGEFDLIICDIGLPAGTGHDVIAGVRKTSATPAIALIGFGMSSDVEQALAAGFDAHPRSRSISPKLEAVIAEVSALAVHVGWGGVDYRSRTDVTAIRPPKQTSTSAPGVRPRKV